MIHKIERNIPKYLAYQFLNGFIFFAPVLVLYLQTKGLTMTQILTLQSIFAFGMVLMEVPTGAVADRYGKRLSLVLGPAFFALGLLVYGFGSHFAHFVIGELMTAVGAAFMSGADNAFLHESLRALDRDAEYTKVTGRTAGLTHAAGALGNILGGVIGTISLGLNFYLSSLSVLAASLVGLTFAEPEKTEEQKQQIHYLEIIRSSIQVIRRSRTVTWLILFFTLTNGLIWILQFYLQPYLQLLNLPLYWFGLVYALFAFVTAAGSFYTDRFDRALGDKGFVVIILTSTAIMLLLGLKPGWTFFPLWLCFNIFAAITAAVTSSRILKIIPSEKSATVLSFNSLARRLFSAVIAPLVGMVSDQAGLLVALQVIGLMLLAGAAALLFAKQKYRIALQ